MAAFQNPIPSNYVAVPGDDSNLWLNPQTMSFMARGAQPDAVPNEWAWGTEGFLPIGGATPLGINTSFLQIRPEYASGAPINAPTWQEAVQRSLAGFVRSNYGVDPIYNWNPNASGTAAGSQFLLGTVQDLANQYPGFFNTQGNLVRNLYTGDIQANHGTNLQYDPLIGLNPLDKILGFEDVPLGQIENAVGGLPGQFVNPLWQQQIAPIVQKRDAIAASYQQAQQAVAAAYARGDIRGVQAGQAQLSSLTQQAQQYAALLNANAYGGQQKMVTSQQLQQLGLKDYNDLLFKLDINQYQPPAPITTADPKAVMKQFFNTAPYQLAFGSEPGVLDPNLSPTERFRFDPGYQFAQTEGLRQLQFDQSKKGLLESGAGMRDIQNFSQGLADQNYQRNLAQNLGLFQNWQQGIAGVMNTGASAAGQVSQNNQQLAQLLAGLTANQGGSLANLTGQTGTNIANLFGNQGTFGGSLFANTGAAQSGNIMNAASLNAQIQAAKIAAEAQKSAAQSGMIGQIAGGALSALGGMI